MTQLTHLDHIEDLILTNGIDGCKRATEILKSVAYRNGEHSVTTKVDGAPSVIAGKCPHSGRFFIGTKSLFNKTPKINFTYADIDKNHGHAPGLCKKLKLGLKYFPLIIKSGIYQGDFMFDEDDLIWNDQGTEVSFKPNTIEYAVSDKKEITKLIRAKVGVIWHTRYLLVTHCNWPSSSEGLQVLFGDDMKEIKDNPNIWTASTEFKDEYNASRMNYMEIAMFDAGLATINNRVFCLMPVVDEIFSRETEISKFAMVFINERIRKGQKFVNREEILFEFLTFIGNKYQKQIDKVIMQKTKAKKQEQYNTLKRDILFKDSWAQSISLVFELHSFIQELKDIIINKMEQVSKGDVMQNYINNVLTGPEGYVIVDKETKQAYKFVKRMEFSLANFNIQKNW